MTAEELMELAKEVNGSARKRLLTQAEAEEMLEVAAKLTASPDVKTIRVYARDSFVAKAYGWSAVARYFEAVRGAAGEWKFSAGTTGAQRSGGSAARVTINGRRPKAGLL